MKTRRFDLMGNFVSRENCENGTAVRLLSADKDISETETSRIFYCTC